MDQEIPDYLQALNLFVRTAVPLTIVTGLWFATRRTSLAPAVQRTTWFAMSAAFVAWFAAAWWLGKTNFFVATGNDQPTIPFAIFVPIVVGLFLILRSKRAAAVIDATPQSWLIGAQIYRALGAMFLLLWAQGRMPGEFAIPAGIGDVIIGVSAPFVAWLNATRSAASAALLRTDLAQRITERGRTGKPPISSVKRPLLRWRFVTTDRRRVGQP